MKRIQEFLLCDQIDESIIDFKNEDAETSIKIKPGSNFHWGQEKKHEDILEDRKSSKKKAKKDKKGSKVDENKELLIEQNAAADLEKLGEEEPEKEVKKEFILKNLNLTIKQGEFVCIIGAVGAGKSSLLSTLIGDMIYSEVPEINPYNPEVEHSECPITIN